MMFPSELRAFHAAAQSGSIRKAAELLNVAPSSVSRKIVLLEQQIGTTLLERASKGVALTHAGVMVAEYARSVVLDYDSLRADLNDARGSRHRLLRLHAVESIVSGGLIDAVAAFRKEFDTVAFRISVVPAPQVVTDVQRGDCDVGLTFGQPPRPDMTTHAKIPEPIVLVVPTEHPLARTGKIELPDLKGIPLALPDTTFGVRRIFDRTIQEAGLTQDIIVAMVSNSFEALRDFVRCNAGGAVLPYRAVRRESTHQWLKPVSISHPSLASTTIDIVTLRKHRSPRVITHFVDVLGRTLAAVIPEL
jgi:DNA-binding transcriptional LysR family regulator